jgi:hypothetical protein
VQLHPFASFALRPHLLAHLLFQALAVSHKPGSSSSGPALPAYDDLIDGWRVALLRLSSTPSSRDFVELAVLGSKQPANGHFVSFWDRTGTAPRCTYRAYHSFAVTASTTGLPGASGPVREETVKGVGRSAGYDSSRLEKADVGGGTDHDPR